MERWKMTWEDISNAVDSLVAALSSVSFNCYVTPAVGGLVPTCLIAERIHKPIYVVNKQEQLLISQILDYVFGKVRGEMKVVVVDDILDTGQTMCKLCERFNVVAVATLYRKTATPIELPKHFFHMDVPKDVWLDFPWEP